uniref:Heparan sulfate proteoglycan 2 n=1 Tax=Tetraodon nigroviridis TaxID=99883 RepID=H3D4F8_TETNG
VYYRALVNFTDSLVYGPELEDIYSVAFNEISEAVVDTLQSEYNRIPGTQTVNVVLIKKVVREDGVDVFVELDVGSDYNSNDEQIRSVLYNVVREGAIASYVTSVQGFQFRRLGEVSPVVRACMADEHRCGDGTCILMEYLCDNRPDCRDMSDEANCESRQSPPPVFTTPPTTTTPVKKPAVLPRPAGPCRVDQATCQNGECISRDYVCDGERDCSDGSDEFRCGTPSPCEPNEFKCKNGRCALKLWRCDGDNDCQDNSDETDCPTRGPGDRCAPEQFECLSDRTCIPASYQCDEEPDCPDRSDEYGCTPPSVTSPPEESVQAARGSTVTFTCQAVGVPMPIITWRLNWGHIPASARISMMSENGRGTLTIRDVKESDQGAYTCEAINAKGLVFGIPDGVLTLTSTSNPGNCPEGHFGVDGRCISCFCAGITKSCKNTGRYRNHISLRFTDEDDFKGVNVTYPSRPGIPPLSSTQLLIDPEMEEFQLVDLSRRFLSLDSFWTLPRQFLGNKAHSYGGSLKYKVRYTLARGSSEVVERPDVILVGNGRRLVYRRGSPTPARVANQKEIKFTEDNWQHSNGRSVTRQDLMMTLANLDSISIRTVYDSHMVSAALSDVVMDTTTVEFSILGHAKNVEECRCPPGYYGLSCETCSPGFERVSGGSYLGTCAGCNCNGHASACDPVNGHCLSCQHHTEGPRCDKCRSGYFGDPSRGRPDDCKPCPCPYYETSRRFSNTCFLDVDNQPTCDACRLGYTGRRCEKCASGYQGNPVLPNGKCVSDQSSTCDNRGVVSSSSRPCSCKNNVAGALCDQCKAGFFHLSAANPDGCLRCFCMGVTKQCASSTWNREQVRGAVNGQLFSLSNSGNTKTFREGISQTSSSEVVYRSFSSLPRDVYYWVLPESFRGDKVTAYGGELQYTVRFSPSLPAQMINDQPDVVLQGNGIFLEHYSETRPAPHASQSISVTFREAAWRRADGQACTREHLLMALADISVFMIRATYMDNMAESSRITDIRMDIAVPEAVGSQPALEVEQCACPQGYRGPSCQECDAGYTRASSGLYLGTCERCNCHGHASSCDPESGSCLQCLHNTAGPRCERCQPGYYGNPVTGGAQACQPCPCPGTASSNQFSSTCYQDTDGQPTCDSCPPGYAGRRCERCGPGYSGNPLLGQRCSQDTGDCYPCDQRGSEGCNNGGACRCKMNVEGPTCTSCKPGNFHLSSENKDGCLSCFCMGVTQQCFSSTYYRDLVSSVFSPGNFQGFALVNQQRTTRISTGFTVEVSTEGTQLSYSSFDYLGQEPHYWQLPGAFQGNKVGSYGGKLQYTISYVAGPRGTVLDDGDVQIIGNDITLVARQPWRRRQQGGRATQKFQLVFREENWRRPDGMPATREHLMMVLADLDDILIPASYSTEMRSSSISDISMEVAVPNYSGLAQALEVEQCRCPPGYQGLSCQDCAPGYTRTGGGLYLGHCELCECNGHSDSCHPETGICSSCLHNTQGELCEQCAPGFFGDPTVGTPEDCQPCACPHADPDNQFSPTCESLGNGGYQCTACQPGYTGQYCERCAPGYVGNPQERVKCRPYDAAASLVVKVFPERVLTPQNSPVTLRCQVYSNPPHYFFWSREDGRSISGSAERRRQGAELYFPNVQPTDAGVYVCTCRDQRGTNRSRAEIVVTNVQSKAIEVTVEAPKSQTVRVGSTVSFICTAKSKSPAYTLVWTRMGNGKLPNRAMDFNGILTIQNVQPEDAGVYVCTGSNMLAMDEGNAVLYVPEASQTRMFYTAYEMFEGHRKPGDGAQPVASVTPPVLNVQQGQRAEFRCTATGNPTPAIEWAGGPGSRMSPRAVIRGGVLTFAAVDAADEGEYTCKALNTHGEHVARVSLVVQMGSQPQVQVSPQNIQVHEGDTLRMYCRATGSPTPRLSWLKNGGLLPAQVSLVHVCGACTVPRLPCSLSGITLLFGFDFLAPPCLTLSVHQAIPSHGFHQFKSNSLDVLHRRIEELQVCPSVCLCRLLAVRHSPCLHSLSTKCMIGRVSHLFEPMSLWLVDRRRSSGPGRPVLIIREGIKALQRYMGTGVDGGSPPLSLPSCPTRSGSGLSIGSVGIPDRSAPLQPCDRGLGGLVSSASESRCDVSAFPRGRRALTCNRAEILAERAGAKQLCPPTPHSHPSTGSSPLVVPEGPQVLVARLSAILRELAGVPTAPSQTSGEHTVSAGSMGRYGPLAPKASIPKTSPCQRKPGATPGKSESNSSKLSALTHFPPCLAEITERSLSACFRQARMDRTDIGTLLIPDVQLSDSGTYMCVGSNSIGSNSAPVKVTVLKGEVPNTVNRFPPFRKYTKGSRISLEPLSTGPSMTSIFHFSNPSPPVTHIGSGRRLTLFGKILCLCCVCVCAADQSFPAVSIQPSTADIQEGQSLELNCVAPGNPPPKVSWWRASGLSSNHQVLGNQLRILSATAEDSGEYTCRVEGTMETPHLVVTRPPSPCPSPHRLHVRAQKKKKKKNERCSCYVCGAVRLGLGSELTHTEASSMPVDGPLLSARWRLHRRNVVFSCAFRQKAQSAAADPRSHPHALLPGAAPPSAAGLQSPIIAIEPHSAVVRVGETATFRCRIYSGAQPVRLEWKVANNQHLPDNVKVSRDGSVITIVNVRPENHGSYRCVASNPFGITHTVVSVIVKDSPVAVVTPAGPVRVRLGQPINLECQASGEPRPSVSWHRLDSNRKTLLTSPVPMETNAVMQVKILAARPEDSGTYVCTARSGDSSTETKVEVIVEGKPTASVPEPQMVVVEGRTATLRCHAHGFPAPVITWSKLRSPLPWRHKVVNSSLVLPSVGRQDSGEYICRASNRMGASQATIKLDVETLPYATLLPDNVAVRAGEVIRLQCLAHGTPPLTYTWTRLDGRLPSRAVVNGGDLQINLAAADDAGSYKCVASNSVGSSEVIAKVAVRSENVAVFAAPLAVRVSPQVEVRAQGSAVEFTCSAAGGLDTTIEWLKEGGALPPNHHVKDGVLRIEDLEQSNEGVYICRASSSFGQAQDTARLTIQALPKVMINVRTSVQTVMIGNSVEFECQALGEPEPTVQWSKVGGSLPAHIMVKGGMLRIEQVTEVDAGQYRCTATNDVGSVQSQVVLNVQSLPQISALPEKKEVTVGSDAVLPCVASGYPAPEIRWSKLEGELPSKCLQEVNVLTVPRVAHEDSGTYVCTASNKQGKVEAFTRLQVHERVMPYFAQEPLSYLTLPTIRNAYKTFNIKVNFRPDNGDEGMILYNGQKRTTGADFISLGLVGGRLEFRFDVGSGMATIRDPNPVKLGEFHTVELYRNHTLGYIVVDGGEPINGSSQGKFQGLDLNEELHVGGYPNYTLLAKTAGIKTGFVGCIRQLVIQGEEVIFKDLHRNSTGVSNCPTCKDRPCQNGGACEDSETSLYRCSCPRGFTGSNCQHHSSLHCHSEACGPDATCINRANGLGYDCRCHLGKFGNKCMEGELVTTPLFDGDQSYIAYPPLTNIHDDLRVELEFKPLERDGLMFFCGGKKMKVEDFVSISMVEGHVEFRYELGTGQAVLLSLEPVSLGQWHKVVAERNKRAGHLKVDQGPTQRIFSPGKAQGLNIHTPMYLGGVPNMDLLPKPANISQMFQGCVGEVSINNKKLDLSYSFTESRAIRTCVDGSPCDRRPCLNGGHCLSSAEYEYQCLCQDGFEGERCEVLKDVCQSNRQCQNGGICVEGLCVCLPAYTGPTCGEGRVPSVSRATWESAASEANDSPYQFEAHFHKDGYISLPKSVFPRSTPDSPETIELEISTGFPDGLILWQGVELGEHGRGKDFISLGLQNGHLLFSYQLGSGEAHILSREAVNDGRWHKVTAVRTGKDGYVQIDGGAAVHGQSRGRSIMVNTKGSVYLGGAPDMVAMTGGKFSAGLSGCVRNLVLMNGGQPAQTVDLQAHAASGFNVQPCSS